ncbi:CPA_1a_G0027940.mRNA.1.CDS.1 [Saccharomyces cerevisiae]|nr:CPA_1a_G0027940.mRNA.1.CDS.1 [Saccharomyces cerevisiae]CAI7250422.1 CPA_1a_G0027940.mRNA.1.CDS.1 [Saccharomyces cerevisiae]
MRMYCFMVPLCILMWGKVRMPIIGVPRCLIKPFSVPVTFPFSVKKNIRILDLDPRTEVYCLSPYSVCSKRLPCKKYFYLLNSYNIKRVLGVVYFWRLQICEFSANALVQLRNCSR